MEAAGAEHAAARPQRQSHESCARSPPRDDNGSHEHQRGVGKDLAGRGLGGSSPAFVKQSSHFVPDVSMTVGGFDQLPTTGSGMNSRIS